MIPLCHPLLLTSVKLELGPRRGRNAHPRVAIRRGARADQGDGGAHRRQRGLTIYDDEHAVDRGMVIEQVQLLEKLGGKSGHYRKEEEGQA
ncbi:cyclic pyranopterin monophosphate synthase MoaC [Pseudomonas aeruginosa]|nr:cyclic pyranopterin monophosphate synthase MoaC [Pseudomonas aeruginosa]